MKLRMSVLTIACLSLLAEIALAEQPTELKAFFRAGQTFITWKESGAAKYNLYRSDKAITDLASAKLVATVEKGSSAYPLEVQRKVTAAIAGKVGYNSRYVIQDNPTADPEKMLPADTGLFVYTPREAGKFFYAVTAQAADGAENKALAAGNSLAEGVTEKQEPIGAVLVYQGDIMGKQKDAEGKEVAKKIAVGRIYCHWMDAADWNCRATGGAAFNFFVAIPDKHRGLAMQLHGYSGTYGQGPPLGDMVTIIPGDPVQSWFYGYRDEAGKKVCNYTERRMVLTAQTVGRLLKAEGNEVNMKKVYIHGGSMGGTGGNFLGAWHGDVFTAVLASKGAVDHNRNGGWTDSAAKLLFGTKEENLPCDDGGKVWDHVNLIKWHVENMDKETAFFLDAHASDDGSVPFTAVPEYYEALQKAKRPFAAVWAPWGHSGFEDPHWPNHQYWGTFQFNSDETVPAIGHASSNDEPKPGGRGEINTHIEWSCRENDFDKTSQKDDLVDQPDRWEMSFRTCNFRRTQSQKKDVAEQAADITPRRCQQFKAKPNGKYHWENWSFAAPAEPKKLAEGTVAADKYGLVTVERFVINKEGWGNRLVIYPEK